MLKNIPLLTVFIATYNRAGYLPAAIEAVLNQTYKNFKLIVLDNASTDNTSDIVKKYTDPRLSYIRNSENIGGVGNGNKAIDMADTKYFIILHDDDYAAPDMLEKEIAVLEADPEIVMVSCNMFLVKNDRIICKSFNLQKDLIFFKGDYLKDIAKTYNKISCPTVMFRTDFIQEKKLYVELSIGPAADIYLWININLYDKKIYVISEPLYYYRIHEYQDSNLNFFDMHTRLYDALLPLYKENGYREYCSNLADNFYGKVKLSLLLLLAKQSITYQDYLSKISLLDSRIKNARKKINIILLDSIVFISRDLYILLYKIYARLKSVIRKVKGMENAE